MKRYINKIVAATFIAGAFVACSDEIESGTYGTAYNANTANIASAGTAVDLGLPSKTLWADKNVGAASAQDMGLSFIWGDVTGTQESATADTYAQGTAIALDGYFNSCKGAKKDVKSIIQIASADVRVVAVDSIRPDYACDLRVERHARVKVKDAEGNFVLDDKGEFVRKDSIFVEVEDVILMSHDEAGYNPALALYLMNIGLKVAQIKEVTELSEDEIKAVYKEATGNDYAQDEYNKYVVAKHNLVYYTDVIEKLVPAEIETIDIPAFVEAAKKAANKDEVWYHFADAVYNEEDNYLHANLVVEAEDIVSYYEGRDDDVAALTIVGTQYDAATKNWGAGWAMPTTAQLQELIDVCDWKYEGTGYVVTGPNGKSIFLPAAGYRYESTLIGAGAAGYYASGEVNGKYSFPDASQQAAGSLGRLTPLSMANIMTFNYGQFDNSKKIQNAFAEKNIGVSIRPVATK